jgi:hypothetical protein
MNRPLNRPTYRSLIVTTAETAVRLVLLSLLFLPLSTFQTGSCFAAPVSTIEKDLAEAQTSIAKGKLTDARKALEKARVNEGSAAHTARIDKLNSRIIALEDSLVAMNLDILRKKGADAAFEYMQEVVWPYGVSREKLDQIETTILNEAPAVQETQERDDLDYALKLLETKQPMDPAIDPYIVKTAQMLLQARADSIAGAQQAAAVEQKTAPVAETPAVIEKPQAAEEDLPGYEKPAEPVEKTIEPVVAVPEPPVEKVVEPVITTPAVQPAEEPAEKVAMVTPAPKRTTPTAVKKVQKPEEYISPALQARANATKEFLKKLKANQQTAQNNVVELYTMLENGQGPEAMQKFRDRRAFISKYISPRVFNVLELTLAQTIIDAKKSTGAVSAQKSAPTSPIQGTIDRLDALMRQNRVEAAYKEFKRDELSIKNYLPKNEFKQFKKMIEDAYELRTGIKQKK